LDLIAAPFTLDAATGPESFEEGATIETCLCTCKNAAETMESGCQELAPVTGFGAG